MPSPRPFVTSPWPRACEIACTRSTLPAPRGARRPWKARASRRTKRWPVLEAAPDQQVLPPERSRDEREVRNAHAAQKFVHRIVQADPRRPLDEALIRGIQSVDDRRLALSRQRARPLPEPCGNGRRSPTASHRRRGLPAHSRVRALVQPGPGVALGSHRAGGARPLLRRQHPPLRRWQRAHLARRRELHALPRRD